MAYKRTRRSYRRRPKRLARYPKRRAYGTGKRRRITRGGGPGYRFMGFPKQQVVTLRYSDGFLLTQADPSHVYRANSPYDPDYTGVIAGHQALGWDQWAQFYDHYVVIGSKITVHMNYGEGGNAVPCVGYIYLDDDQGTYTLNQLVESGVGKTRFLGMTEGKQGPVSIRNTYSAKKFFNITNTKDNVDRLGAAVTANPSEDVYFNVGILPYSDQVSAEAEDIVTGRVTIDYIVLFSEPKTLPTS